MKELAYHILDIANNSVRGEAKEIIITIDENIIDNKLSFTIEDDGKGIPPDMLKTIKDPFTTSRTFRKVGLGIPFLNDTCVQCNGSLQIESTIGVGTTVNASMEYNNIDRPPLGNMPSTMMTLITSEGDINIKYIHRVNQSDFAISTKDLTEILGDVPLNTPDVMMWLKDFLSENIDELRKS